MPIYRTPTGPITSPRLEHSPPEYQQLLAALFSRAPRNLWLELRRIPQGGGRPAQRFVRMKKLRSLKIREREGQHQYYGVLPRLERGNGRREGIALATCLWLDLDTAPVDPGWWGLPAPTAVVKSSEEKHQLYWVLTPTKDLTRLEECNARLAQLAGGDPAVFDRARVMRLPGFQNWKYAPAPVAQLVDLDANRVYTLDELEAKLPELEEPIGTRRSGGDARDRRGRLEARSSEDQVRFAELWRLGWGLEIRPGVQAAYWCVFHESASQRNDLWIDAAACVWKCWSCQRSGGLTALEFEAEVALEARQWAEEVANQPESSGQAGDARGSDALFPYGDTPVQQSGIILRTLNDWRLAWEEQEGLWALEGSWGTIADTQAACLAHNKVVYGDAFHKTAGKAACADPFHPGHQPRAMYHLRTSEDREQGYPGLPETLAIYRESKTLTLEEAAQDYRPRFEELKAETRRTTGRVRNPAKLRAQAIRETPLARVLDSALPNAVSRFARKARDQGRGVYQWRKFVEYKGGEVVVEQYFLADAGISWGRMRDVSLVSEGQKLGQVMQFTDPAGLGIGGWSRSQWPEELARAVIEVLESRDGRKGRTRAGWFPGAKELVAAPAKSPCPECGGQKILVGPVQHYHVLEGPIESDVTGGYYYRVVDTRKRRRVPAWMRTQDMDLAAD